ncbi:hypothetical protein N9H39_08040 [Gammaproteobacteria bacterium]|nr:hypothetical protein [Gammaproteobacteria bacterium]
MKTSSKKYRPLMVLTTVNENLAAKVVCKNVKDEIEIKDYQCGKYFTVGPQFADSIFSLSECLLDLEKKQHSLVIRGELIPGMDLSGPVTRTSYDIPSKGQKAYFRSAQGVQWICIDVDKMALPKEMDVNKHSEKVIRYIIKKLPKYFHDVTCHWQFSASAGVFKNGTVSLHLWFWLSRPVSDHEAKEWAMSVKEKESIIDISLYNPVQAHYTAAPIFKDGIDDPMAKRSGLLTEKADTVQFPAAGSFKEKPIKKYQSTGYQSGLSAGKNFDYWLKQVGDHPGGSGFHLPLLKAVWAYVGKHGKDTNKETLKKKLRATIKNADQSKHDTATIQERASDQHLDGLIDSAIQKLGDSKKTGKIAGVEPHYPPKDYLSPKEAQTLLGSHIVGFFDAKIDTAIKATAGLGKTSQLVSEYLPKQLYSTSFIEVYVPTHALASELAAQFSVGTLPSGWSGSLMKQMAPVVIRGRSHIDEQGNTLCKKSKLAGQLSAKGLKVFPRLCANHNESLRCPYYSECGYIKQFTCHEDMGVRIFTHPYLGLERGFLDKDMPKYAVIDESYFSALLEDEQISISHLLTSDVPDALSVEIDKALSEGRPLLKSLRDKFNDELMPLVSEAIKKTKPPKLAIHPNMDSKAQSSVLHDYKYRPDIEQLFKVLKTELKTGRSDSHGITRNGDKITVHHRKDISRFSDKKDGEEIHVPVLAIDADLDPEIHRTFFPDAACHEVNVERNCHVVQVHSTLNSKYSLSPPESAPPKAKESASKRINEINQLVKREAKNKKLLVVGPQDITGNPKQGKQSLISVPETSALAHFGAIRGVDAYKDKDTVIVIGRNQPSILDVEAIARALYFDSPEPLIFCDDWIVEPRGYTMRTGELVGVNVVVHPDPRVQRLLEHIREKESLQAIDRSRLVHSENIKRVILLSNLPLDLTVDELVSWKELMSGGGKLEQAWDQLNGVMPLSQTFLSKKFPQLFSTKDKAKGFLKKFSQKGGKPNNITISNSTLLSEYGYRLKGKAGKNIRCLSEYGPAQTKKELEKLHGIQIIKLKKLSGPSKPDSPPVTHHKSLPSWLRRDLAVGDVC